MMKLLSIKRILVILLISLTTIEAQAVVLKIATVSPEGSSWTKKIRAGAEQVAKKTNNNVRFKFYTGGVMGSDQTVLRKISIRQLHGAAVTAGSLAQFFPDTIIYNLPFKFRSLEEVGYVRQHMDQLIMTGLEKKGFVVLGLAGGGFAYIMSKGVSISSVAELREQKVWVPDHDVAAIETIKAFSVTPVPLPIGDVLTGLQTGLINTVATPPIGALVLQWHNQIKYITDIPLIYVYGMLAVDSKVFAKIAPADQKITLEIMRGVFQEIDYQTRNDNIEAANVLKKQGIKYVKPENNSQKWQAISLKVIKNFVKTGKLSSTMLGTLDKHLNNYRTQKTPKTPKTKKTPKIEL